MSTATFLNREEFLAHWQGHRNLTRKIIEKYPDAEFSTFSIGGMRPFSEIVKELLTVGLPGLKAMVSKDVNPYSHDIPLADKAEALKLWDQQTAELNQLFQQLDDAALYETFNLFGQFEDKNNNNLLYFVENEIHHRAQAYVYLRALGIEPPFFWDRD